MIVDDARNVVIDDNGVEHSGMSCFSFLLKGEDCGCKKRKGLRKGKRVFKV